MSTVDETLGTCSFILFKTTRDWAREANFPKPNGDMLTEPWLRVGCPPLTIATQARKEGADVQNKDGGLKPANPWAEKPFELMSYDELLAVKSRVDQEFNARGPGELEALKEKLTLIAQALGMSPADLFGKKPRGLKERKKREVENQVPKPDNPGEVWTGIGKPKKWLQEKLDQGRHIEEFAVA